MRTEDDMVRRIVGELVVAAYASILIIGAILLPGSPSWAEENDDPMIAEVNGTPIHRRAVREIVKSVVATSSDLPSSSEIDELTKEALDSLIDLELLYQEAQARGISVSDEAVDDEVDAVREQFTDEDEFAAALYRSGLTEAQLRADTAKTLVVNYLLDTVVWRDVTISEEAIQAFYVENRTAFDDPPRIRVRQILVRVAPGSPPAKREEALVKIKGLREQLLAGADFAQVARDHSEDQQTAAAGGDLGYLDQGRSDAIAKAARALQPGEFSDIVQTSDGYHVLEVTEQDETGSFSLSPGLRARITLVLKEDERRRQEAAFVADLREKAEIKFIVPTPAPIEEESPADDPGKQEVDEQDTEVQESEDPEDGGASEV